MERDDQVLVERSQRGDQAAFRQLVERYQRKVYGLACGMVHNTEDALDITQEAFVKAFRSLDRFQGTSSFYTWLYRITVNLCIDFLRRGRRSSDAVDYDDRIGHQEEVNEGEFPLVSSVGTETPAGLQGRRELAEQMEKALQALTEKHREIILLREVDGLSYTEIADALHIRKGTVMSRLFHARQNLQRMLKPYVERGKATTPERAGTGHER